MMDEKRKNGTRCNEGVGDEPAMECGLQQYRKTKCQLVTARQQSPRRVGLIDFFSYHFLFVNGTEIFSRSFR